MSDDKDELSVVRNSVLALADALSTKDLALLVSGLRRRRRISDAARKLIATEGAPWEACGVEGEDTRCMFCHRLYPLKHEPGCAWVELVEALK